MMRFEWNWWDLRNELKCNWRLIPNDEWTNWFTEREDAAMDQWDRPPKCYWGGGILLVMVNGKGAVSAVPPFLGWIFPFFLFWNHFCFLAGHENGVIISPVPTPAWRHGCLFTRWLHVRRWLTDSDASVDITDICCLISPFFLLICYICGSLFQIFHAGWWKLH